MFVGYNVPLTDLDRSILTNAYKNIGSGLFDKQKKTMNAQLKTYALEGSIIDANKLKEDWFPDVKAHIFISHSHADKNEALSLAGWLHSQFGIVSFIDSCVWGYANDLLRCIDEKYCVLRYDSDGKIDTFSYSDRNKSTAHVHMILGVALQRMINKTECLFFLNSPNSLSLTNIMDGEATDSPWIFGELFFTSIVRKKPPREHRSLLVRDSALRESMGELQIKYRPPLNHLIELNNGVLKYVANSSIKHKPYCFLDTLYRITDVAE